MSHLLCYACAKKWRFQNMLGPGQHGSHLLDIDASSNPMKFRDDWPSGSGVNLFLVRSYIQNLHTNWLLSWNQIQKISKKWQNWPKGHSFKPKPRTRSVKVKTGLGKLRIWDSVSRKKGDFFKTFSDRSNMDRICSVSMLELILQSLKMIGRLEVL